MAFWPHMEYSLPRIWQKPMDGIINETFRSNCFALVHKALVRVKLPIRMFLQRLVNSLSDTALERASRHVATSAILELSAVFTRVDSVPFVEAQCPTVRGRLLNARLAISALHHLYVRVVVDETDVMPSIFGRSSQHIIDGSHHVIECFAHFEFEVLPRGFDVLPHSPGDVVAEIVIYSKEASISCDVDDAVGLVHFWHRRLYELGHVLVQLSVIGDVLTSSLHGLLALVLSSHVELVDAIAEDRRKANIVSTCRYSQEIDAIIEGADLFLEDFRAGGSRTRQNLVLSLLVVTKEGCMQDIWIRLGVSGARPVDTLTST